MKKVGVHVERISAEILRESIDKIKKEDPEWAKGIVRSGLGAAAGFAFFGPVGAAIGALIGGLISEKEVKTKQECISILNRIRKKLEEKDIIYLSEDECKKLIKCFGLSK